MLRRFILFFIIRKTKLFMEICPLKICLEDFSFWRCAHRDISNANWSVGDLSLFEDLFMEICHLKIYLGDFPFMKMCSWRFIYWKLKCRRFIPFWRFVHKDLSFENLNRRFIPWRFVHGYLSFENLNRRFVI